MTTKTKLRPMSKMERKYWLVRQVALTLVATLVFQLFYPFQGLALTTGPSQPEVMQFQQAGTTGMVDPFTGGFNYNIPLFELPGPNGSYPFNLAYQSGVSMDQEASWVGLGWSLQPGAITRNMRGIPDEFEGDEVKVEQDMKPDWTVGVTAGIGFELFGADFDDLNLSSSSLNLYYNSYRGFGYGFDFNKGFKNRAISANLNLSLDSQDGIGISPSISLDTDAKDKVRRYSLGMGLNSRRGLTDLSFNTTTVSKDDGVKSGVSGRIGFSSAAYTPLIDREMDGIFRSLTIKNGISILGSDPNLPIGGSYSLNQLREKSLFVPAYGYLNLHAAEEDGMLDVNRENDGVIRKESPNLAAPMLTHDVYQISGQGVGGTFRAWRNDVGVVGNRRTSSKSNSATAGFEINGTKPAVDYGLGVSSATSGLWKKHNAAFDTTGASSKYGFHGNVGRQADYEPWYFKVMGDLSADPVSDLSYIGGSAPVRLSIEKIADQDGRQVGHLKDALEDKNGTLITGLLPRDSYLSDPNRRARNTVIDHVRVKEIKTNPNGFGEYRIKHFQTAGTTFSPHAQAPAVALDRQHADHHFAGMSVQQTDGARYIYGLPAYNKKQVECVFSVDGSGTQCGRRIDIPTDGNGELDYKIPFTEKFLYRTETPEYAHSYLLTSVLGADYIDADEIPGPSDGDLGFWVKFNYVKVNNYKWRAPFTSANLDKGQLSTIEDDKANYMYGEREEWYLASAETKTHIAEFEIETRDDNRGAKAEFQNEQTVVSNIQEANSYRLSRASLFSKLDPSKPIVAVDFGYSYELCQGVPNNKNYGSPSSTERGKLTLKTVTFTHEESTRGQLTPYMFTYGTSNPGYNAYSQDKWGNYRPYDSNKECEQLNYPYTQQDTTRAVSDAWNSAWHLNQIDLPTGGRMQVHYEANDYGYVQDKPAMQMYRVVGTRVLNTWSNLVYNAYRSGNNASRAEQRKLYIDLGAPVYSTTQLDSIMGGINEVFIKSLIDMKNSSMQFQEYISAFLKIEGYGPYLSPGQTLSSGTSIAYIQFAPCDWNDGKLTEYHPLAVAAWTHLRTHLPQLMAGGGLPVALSDPGTSASALEQQVRSLFSLRSELIRMFSGFYTYANASNWASRFDTENTWVRLRTRSMTKIGGGCRVKKITLDDRFNLAKTNAPKVETGVVYDYSMIENGCRISAGVAAYEPMIGGEENPHRYSKTYPASTPLMTSYNLFAQMPVNEHYMPAPTIGYRQVTVKSLATQQVMDAQLAATVPTTGAAIHEFWTAKDFPVSTSETVAAIKPYRLQIPIPFIGTLAFDDLTGSQGYAIELNDMHGKPKRVSNYGIEPSGQLSTNPIDWVEYEYAHIVTAPGTSKESRKLTNVMNTLVYDVDSTDHSKSRVEQKTLGLDHEYFVDMRESSSESGSGGLAINSDLVVITFIPTIWPNASYSRSRVRTAVTNKIIHRQGILTGVRAYNQGSLVKTENLYFDAQTGRPLLTRVTNDYDAPIYSYEYPAFWAYSQMGPSYKNIGLTLLASNVSAVGGNVYGATGYGSAAYKDLLVPGDEMMVAGAGISPAKAYFVGFQGSTALFFSEANIAGSDVFFRVQRSGRRNLVGVSAEQIVSLRNPTINRGNQYCYRNVNNPTAIVDSSWVTTTYVDHLSLASCMSDVTWILNTFFQHPASQVGGGYYFVSGTPLFGCGNCPTQTVSTLNTQTILVECYSNCSLQIVDNSGTPYPVANIAQISSLALDTTPAQPIGAGFGYGISVQVQLNGSSTPVQGWLTGCTDMLSAGVLVTEEEVNTYHNNLIATPSDDILETEMYMLDSVLSATATVFSDAWMQDFSGVRFESGNAATQLQRLEGLAPFANGQRGIWRPKDSYVYVADRRQSTDLNTAKDGTFSGVPMFDFQSITFDDCAQNWRKVNEVTRYSPYGTEIENRDALDIHSAALYGYNGKLPIAVAANTNYQEFGFESFEEYVPGASVNVLGLSTGNLNFPTNSGTTSPNVWTYTDMTYGQASAFFLHGTLTASLLIHPVIGTSINGMVQGRTHGATFSPSVPFGEKLPVTIPGAAPYTVVNTAQAPYLHQNTVASPRYAGRIAYQRPVLAPSYAYTSSTAYTAAKAHTGKQSLLVNGEAKFPQNRLKLREGETYSLQLWTSRDNTDQPSYRDPSPSPTHSLGAQVIYHAPNGSVLGQSDVFQPSGHLVEGWQKIEGDFSIPAGTEHVVVRLHGGKPGGVNVDAYFDDIRIQPLKSKVSCHVYDPANYKLRATLDDDNFATIYQYDEAGNLYLVQRETLEGMRTIQESRGFLAE